MNTAGPFDPEEVAAMDAQLDAELREQAKSDDPVAACYARMMLVSGKAFYKALDAEIDAAGKVGIVSQAVANLCSTFIISASMAATDGDVKEDPESLRISGLLCAGMIRQLALSVKEAFDKDSKDTLLTASRKPLSS